MPDVNITKFGRLVVGEKFRLPRSTGLMTKETLREEAEIGWVNASYDDPDQGQPCYFADDTPVVRRRSGEGKEVRLKSPLLQYQCIRCQKWVEENDAAMSREGVMCLDCYALTLKYKQQGADPSSSLLARL
jgi:DNA-directed RNA polymerase subunit RPC12/RpoP